jgi:hypothetical protein
LQRQRQVLPADVGAPADQTFQEIGTVLTDPRIAQ